jgi:P27 family predicted phage terminase small subunit
MTTMPGTSGSGKRPLPTAIKKLRGNPGHRSLNDAEPVPAREVPDIPEGLSELAIAEWNSIVPELACLGVLSKIDGKALGAYCECYAEWVQAKKEVTDRGILVKEPAYDKKGKEIGYKLKRNPAIAVKNEALKLMKSFLIEFGLTPASRARLHVEKPADPDPFDIFLASQQHDQTPPI